MKEGMLPVSNSVLTSGKFQRKRKAKPKLQSILKLKLLNLIKSSHLLENLILESNHHYDVINKLFLTVVNNNRHCSLIFFNVLLFPFSYEIFTPRFNRAFFKDFHCWDK